MYTRFLLDHQFYLLMYLLLLKNRLYLYLASAPTDRACRDAAAAPRLLRAARRRSAGKNIRNIHNCARFIIDAHYRQQHERITLLHQIDPRILLLE